MVIDVGNGSMEVQTQTSGYTIGLSPTTQVIRQMVGSGADLRVNARVQLHCLSGTNVVARVMVDRRPAPRPFDVFDRWTDAKSTGQAAARHSSTKQPHGGTSRPSSIWGRITRVAGSSITVRDLAGHVATFRLADNVAITVLVAGRLSDISIGEMVSVLLNRTGTAALTVTIMESS
jgi:hypothetical protein